MTLGERIRQIRNDLDMTREVFGESLGVSGDVINNLERNRVKNINDAVLRLLCKTYRVNYFWLTKGLGDPYIDLPEIIVDEVVEEYQLDNMDKRIIEEYVKLEPEVRDALKKYLKSVFKNTPD